MMCIFRRELVWFYQDGASIIYPDAWEEYLKPIPEVRTTTVRIFKKQISSSRELLSNNSLFGGQL